MAAHGSAFHGYNRAMADAAWYANDVAVVAATISGVSLAVSGFAVWYGRRQTLAAERQAQEATNARRLSEQALAAQAEALRAQSADTSRALEIAQRNANASERLAEANEALAISGQRGWFIVEGHEASINHCVDGKISVTVVFSFRNVGRTPISSLSLRHCAQISQKHPDSYVGLTQVDCENILPDGVYQLQQHFTCTGEQWSDIKRGDSKIFFFGNLTYSDVFGYSRNTYWDYEHNGNELLPCPYRNKFD